MEEDSDHAGLVAHDVLAEASDLPNEVGSTAWRAPSSDTDIPIDGDRHEMQPTHDLAHGLFGQPHSGFSRGAHAVRGPHLGHVGRQLEARFMRQQWEVNYKEAAIFLEEGENNDKFTHHPRSADALPAYLMVHNVWFHLVDLGAALVLLGLGFFESPCAAALCVPTQIHSSIELCALVLVAVQLYLKTRWLGASTFVRHKRSMLKATAVAIMFVEAIVVIVRSDTHFRVSRALRPIFLVDNYFCGGVRRFIRQILQSLPPILDMLVLVFFVMLIYSVFGFYVFGSVDQINFGTLGTSFVSLFVCITTANFPDLMMTSFNASRWSVVYFVSYISINLYFLLSLMLAVVYDAFTRIEKDKFRRLLLHKRRAAQHAFKLLVTRDRPDEISFQHFAGLLKCYRRRTSPTEAYLIFKLLNISKSGFITLEEFYDVYDACLYSWRLCRGRDDDDWFSSMGDCAKKVLGAAKVFVTHRYFEYAMCTLVLINGVILVLQTALMDSPTIAAAEAIYAPWVAYFFVGVYTFEAALKLLALGIGQYFSSQWNVFDFTVTVLGILSLVLLLLGIPMFYVVILRPLRLLTLLRMKRRFRDVFGTAVILVPRLSSAVLVLMLVYYFFAVIGMECFHDVELINCCKNTSVEQYFSFEEGSHTNAYFYLNNFNNLAISGVTLFELTVVNNWHIIMEGYALTTVSWSRLFFMIFYTFTMIVMTIIVAFILEAFLFRIQYKTMLSKTDENRQLRTEILLTSEEIERVVRTIDPNNAENVNVAPNSTFKLEGLKSRTKEQLQMLMYTDEMGSWLAEEARREEGAGAATSTAHINRRLRQIAEENLMVGRGEAGDEGPRPEDARRASQQGCSSGSDVIQVVADEDEVTTIHRRVLPDVGEDDM